MCPTIQWLLPTQLSFLESKYFTIHNSSSSRDFWHIFFSEVQLLSSRRHNKVSLERGRTWLLVHMSFTGIECGTQKWLYSKKWWCSYISLTELGMWLDENFKVAKSIYLFTHAHLRCYMFDCLKEVDWLSYKHQLTLFDFWIKSWDFGVNFIRRNQGTRTNVLHILKCCTYNCIAIQGNFGSNTPLF